MALNSTRVNSQRFAGSGGSQFQLRPRIGAAGQTSTPAINAMRQTGTQMPTSPGGAATTAPGGSAVSGTSATGQVPKIDVQQVDTTRMDNAYGQQDATYDRMLADQQKMWGDTQHMIQQNFSGQMRRNASNAARMGLSVGGASYLSGQRSAMNQAGNYARQAGLDSWNQQRDIMGGRANAYGQRAGTYGNVAGANATAQNAANTNQWQAGMDIDRATAEQGAQAFANRKTSELTRYDTLFDQNTTIDTKNKKGPEYEQYSALANAVQNAPDQASYEAALAKLQAFYIQKQAEMANRDRTNSESGLLAPGDNGGFGSSLF